MESLNQFFYREGLRGVCGQYGTWLVPFELEHFRMGRGSKGRHVLYDAGGAMIRLASSSTDNSFLIHILPTIGLVLQSEECMWIWFVCTLQNQEQSHTFRLRNYKRLFRHLNGRRDIQGFFCQKKWRKSWLTCGKKSEIKEATLQLFTHVLTHTCLCGDRFPDSQ